MNKLNYGTSKTGHEPPQSGVRVRVDAGDPGRDYFLPKAEARVRAAQGVLEWNSAQGAYEDHGRGLV